MATHPVPRLVPRTLTELGRIRAGARVANKSGQGTHPAALQSWRLTSKDRGILAMLAQDPAIGGTVQRWEGEQVHGVQYELYTATDTLTICLPTFKPISLSYELWSGGGCQRRCDGLTVERCPLTPALVGQPCQCPADDHERAALATKGKACHRTLRLWVLLPDAPGVGFWRLDSHGFYAASELLGQLAVWQQAGMQSGIIEGRLRLEQREQKRPGADTLQYVVPVLTTTVTLRQLAQAAQTQQGFLVAPATTPLVPQMHAADAVTEIWGPEAGAKFLGAPLPEVQEAEVITVAPVPPPAPPPPSQAAVGEGRRLRTAIDTLLMAQGLDAQRLSVWTQGQAQKYAVATWSEMPVDTLAKILAQLDTEVQARHAKHAAALTDEELEAWRQQLLHLALDILALLDGTQDPAYDASVREQCARAQQVVRDRASTEADAAAWFDLLRSTSDTLSRQLGLAF